MKARSAKNKGKRLQNDVVKMLLEQYSGMLESDDIKSTTMGESGEDIQLSPAARKILPYNFECKNQEKLNIWSALGQAEKESKKRNTVPLTVFKRNRSKTYVALQLTDFLEIINKLK